jgi:hypothetical protein
VATARARPQDAGSVLLVQKVGLFFERRHEHTLGG